MRYWKIAQWLFNTMQDVRFTDVSKEQQILQITTESDKYRGNRLSASNPLCCRTNLLGENSAGSRKTISHTSVI